MSVESSREVVRELPRKLFFINDSGEARSLQKFQCSRRQPGGKLWPRACRAVHNPTLVNSYVPRGTCALASIQRMFHVEHGLIRRTTCDSGISRLEPATRCFEPAMGVVCSDCEEAPDDRLRHEVGLRRQYGKPATVPEPNPRPHRRPAPSDLPREGPRNQIASPRFFCPPGKYSCIQTQTAHRFRRNAAFLLCDSARVTLISGRQSARGFRETPRRCQSPAKSDSSG